MTRAEAIRDLIVAYAETAVPFGVGDLVPLINALVGELSLATAQLAEHGEAIERLEARLAAIEARQ